MLYKLIAAFCFAGPLLGLIAIEIGAEIPGGVTGYPNGATAAFASFCIVVAGVAYLLNRSAVLGDLGASPGQAFVASVNGVFIRSTIALIPMAAFVFVGLGGYESVLGEIGSGEFRSTLGGGGAVGYLILKYYAPSILALNVLAASYAGCSLWSWRIGIIAALCAIIALSFGFKSGVVLMALPAAMLLLWRRSLKRTMLFVAGGVALIVLGYMSIGGLWSLPDIVAAILARLFVLQADITWQVFGQFTAGADFPSYWNTLPPILGDRAFSLITGITRADPDAWVNAHFNLMATSLSGYPPEAIIEFGHNGSATVFTEGLVAGGAAGVLFFAVLAAFVLVAVYRFIDNQMRAGRIAMASIAACYFIMGVMAWLIGGGLAELVHVSIVFAVATGVGLLWWVQKGTSGVMVDTQKLFNAMLATLPPKAG